MPDQATAQITAVEASVEVLVVVLAVAAGISTLAGGCAVVWWFVKPRVQAWAVTQIVDPVRNVEKQVTLNGGRSNPPTLLDKVGKLGTQVADIKDQLDAVKRAQINAASRAAELADVQGDLAKKFDDHVLNASRADLEMWSAIHWIAQGKPAERLFKPSDPDADAE